MKIETESTFIVTMTEIDAARLAFYLGWALEQDGQLQPTRVADHDEVLRTAQEFVDEVEKLRR